MGTKKINSIQKGKRGEREIANLLTEITGVKFKRVPCSGGLFTSQGSEEFAGDVYSTEPVYKEIVVEVKNHTGAVTFNDFFYPKSKLNSWVNQLKEEAGLDKLGILFFKTNGKWMWYIYYSSNGNVVAYNYMLEALKKISYKPYHRWGLLKDFKKNEEGEKDERISSQTETITN